MTPPEPVDAGRGRKRDDLRTILMYAQDSKGMGHITRAQIIARHLLAANPHCIAYIATESPIIGGFDLPERCDYVKLPKRLSPEGPAPTAQQEEAEKDYFRDIRSAILREVALALSPDLVVVDHVPLGYRGEFRDGLLALKAARPATKFVLGLRDIQDEPAFTRAQWQAHGEYDALERLYDLIAVYSQPGIYDVANAYDIPAAARAKLRYLGFIIREPPPVDPAATRQLFTVPPKAPLIVATVGSGFDGFPVLDAVQSAMQCLLPRHPGLHAILVTGPLMPPAHRSLLQSHATPQVRVVTQADNIQLMACADAVVSMGGYNSVFEALRLTRPLVIVPRANHKIEQKIRADAVAGRGLAQCVLPTELSGPHLAAALEWALGRDPVEHTRRVRWALPSFDGAARLTEHVTPWLQRDGSTPTASAVLEDPVGRTS